MPRHKGKQFLTVPAKKPSGGGVGFFHPLKHPTNEKFDDTTGGLCDACRRTPILTTCPVHAQATSVRSPWTRERRDLALVTARDEMNSRNTFRRSDTGRS